MPGATLVSDSEEVGVRKFPGGWIGAVIVLVFLLRFWALILTTVVLCGLVWGAWTLGGVALAARRDRLDGQRAAAVALAARAQIQHEQYLAGDDRGLYGEYRPSPLA